MSCGRLAGFSCVALLVRRNRSMLYRGLWQMDTEQGMDTDLQTQLYRSRMRLKREMQRALACISPASKRQLAARWKQEYSALFYKELINCAKNKQAAITIADWDLDKFDNKRVQK